MIINRQKLLKFLKSIALASSEDNNNDMIFKFSDDKIETIFTTKGNIYAIFGTLHGKFDNLGEVGIFDINKIIMFLSTMPSDEVEISVENNKFVLKCPKFAFRCVFKAGKYVVNTITPDKQKELILRASGAEFSLSTEDMASIISIYSSIKSEFLMLKGSKNKVELYLEDSKENSVLARFDSNDIKEFTVKLGKVFVDLLKLADIKSPTIFSIKNEAPILIKNTWDGYEVSYLLAPIKIANNK